MHFRQLSVLVGLVAAAAAGAAVIYKWTDADGVVHYSDQQAPGAERIVILGGTQNGIGGKTPAASPSSAAKGPAAHFIYTVASIDAPEPEKVFFNNDPVTVRLHLEPTLQPNQGVTWMLNGKPLSDQGPEAVTFTLPQLPRGSYSLAAVITDMASGDTLPISPVNFYVREPSLLSPQHKKTP